MGSLVTSESAELCACGTVNGIGALVGDVVGSPYEFDHNNIKTEDFPLFSENSRLTDDSVMTQAVTDGFIETWGLDDAAVREGVIRAMMREGKKYPRAGYGAMFRKWLKNPEPYGSYGNGSAMRVSAVGWLFDQLDDVRKYATLSADISHNHPEGIKGAQATALAIYLTRCGLPKDTLKAYLTHKFGYNLERTLNDIRPDYHHVESCMETVPEALTAYFEGQNFEDVVRKAVSLGGDSDTLTAIAASIAEARYGIPDDMRQETLRRMDAHQRQLLDKFAQLQNTRHATQRACMDQLLALLPAFAAYPPSGDDKALSEFIHLVHDEHITMRGYLELLQIFDMSMAFELDDARLNECSILVLRAVLTFIGRSDYSCEGSLEEAAQSGFIAKVLLALQERVEA